MGTTLAALYKNKKDLKASVGRRLNYKETSMFGSEFDPDGTFCVVGPDELTRKWYARVTMAQGRIYSIK